MTSEFEENDIEETAEEEAEEEAEYETEEEVGEEAEEEVKEKAEYETEEEAEYKNEEEAESETEENQVDDTETKEQQIEKNIEREVEQEETNTKKRSWVWEHFTYDETVNKAKCKHCKILIACNKGSTSGMAGHIKSKHKLMKEKGKKQLTIRESINNSKVIVYSKETFKKFIIRWIVKNDLPFTCVESEDFCNMIFLLHKDAFIPSADTIKNYIMTSFNDSQKKVASILQNTSSKISFTIDAWTSSNNFSFLGITAHWVTENWKLKSFLLDFIKLEGPHSGANIKDAFLKSLKNFNIESKILGVTTDNASNNVTFLKAVESNLSQKYIYYDSEDKHVRCLAHVINLAAQQVLTTLKATDNDESSNEEVEDFRDTPNRFENGKEAAINAINKLKIYYNKTDSTLYAVSLILDLRLKVEYMKNNEWETQWVDRTKKTVSELYMMLYTPQETQNTNIEYNSSDEDLVSHISKWRRIETVSEFDRYFNADRAQALCDTLNWWKEEYPNLSNMVKDYLGVPATSALAEHIFSSAADVITYDRASLAPETVRAVECLKHWFHSVSYLDEEELDTQENFG
ncbi:unnamed protein product [Rhizophagus irregularis]|uniref:BED-type domain-containing protein n=1 Tax=Rhizophagus irregularis TaxID=588596 RepID=A0A915ZP35_9GLOM|nr:unnamed protein product [Rhizophagus irregularis]